MAEAVDFPSKNTKKAIFQAWLIVGTLDILFASINYFINTGKTPVNVLVYISSGIFGGDVAQMDRTTMATLGLLLHYFIAFSWTLIFFTIYPRMPFLSRNRILTGIGYGIVIWTIMSQVVVKLSNTAKGPFNLQSAVVGAAILCVAIGIPLSFLAYRHFERGKR